MMATSDHIHQELSAPDLSNHMTADPALPKPIRHQLSPGGMCFQLKKQKNK